MQNTFIYAIRRKMLPGKTPPGIAASAIITPSPSRRGYPKWQTDYRGYRTVQPSTGRDVAEVNYLVSESFRNRGISTKLVEHLVNIARENGIIAFATNMLPENEEMMNVFTGYGLHAEREIADGELRDNFPIAPTAAMSAGNLERKRRATITSVRL